ncbi:MAG: hypothetical protein HN783_03850, partial [Ilumatobacter sp.]|nr:hypothetical protein [Ilumatobacter sp.]
MSKFTTSTYRDRDADWSPDGEWILFGSVRSGNEDIWKKRVAGGEAIQLTDATSREDYAVWSPTGDRIAFSSNRDGPGNIYTMSAAGGEWTRVTQDADAAWESGPFGSVIDWSPDGEWIVYTKDVGGTTRNPTTHLWAISVDGTQRRQLTSGEFSDRLPNWSPDG